MRFLIQHKNDGFNLIVIKYTEGQFISSVIGEFTFRENHEKVTTRTVRYSTSIYFCPFSLLLYNSWYVLHISPGLYNMHKREIPRKNNIVTSPSKKCVRE